MEIHSLPSAVGLTLPNASTNNSGTSESIKRESFTSFRATLKTSLHAPVRLLPLILFIDSTIRAIASKILGELHSTSPYKTPKIALLLHCVPLTRE